MLLLLLLLFLLTPLHLSFSLYSTIHKDLKSLDQLISHSHSHSHSRFIKPSPPSISFQKLSHFLPPSQLSFPLTLLQSPRLSSKLNTYPNLLLSLNPSPQIYSLTGEPLLSLPNPSLISSIRNQHFFVLTQQQSLVQIKEARLRNKSVELQDIFKISSSQEVTAFVTGGGLKTRSLFLMGYRNGSVVRYTDRGEYRGHSDYLVGENITKMTKTANHLYLTTPHSLYILQLFRAIEDPTCSLPLSSSILTHFSHFDNLYIHINTQLLTYSLSRCQLVNHLSLPQNSTVHSLGDKILVVRGSVVYYLNPENNYQMGMVSVKVPENVVVSTDKRSEYSILISAWSENQGVNVYEYVWQGEQQGWEMKGFKMPIMLVIFGIVVYYAYKNKNKNGNGGNGKNENEKQMNEEERRRLVEQELEGLEKLSPEELKKMLQRIRVQEKKGK